MTTLQIHSHKRWKEGFVLGNSSCLKIQGFERYLSYYLVFLVIIYLFQLREFLAADFLHLGAPLLGKGCAGGAGVSGFSAAEAEFLFDAMSAFFQGELRDFDGIDNHGVGVMGFGVRGTGERVVGLVEGFRVSFGNIISSFPLGLEGNGRHDAAHQGGWDSCEKYLIKTSASEMLARAMWFLKVEIQWLKQLSQCLHVFH